MRQRIEFYTDEGVPAPQLRLELVRQWLTDVAQHHGGRIGELCYQFCDDEAILRANREFLDHDYYTDIITFHRSTAKCWSADLLISLDTVRSNAQALGVDWALELHRVMVHGLLHLTGLGDKTPEEEAQMRRAEDEALALLLSRLPQGQGLLLSSSEQEDLAPEP